MQCQSIRAISRLQCHSRAIHLTACCEKNLRSAVPKITNDQSKKLTYEQAMKPEEIGVTKGWNSYNTSNLYQEEDRTAETTFEDFLIRRFIQGTWRNLSGLFLSEVIIKRRSNVIIISGLVIRNRFRNANVKYYFLKGYTEEFLSYYLKRPVKLEIQTVHLVDDMIFKKI